MADDKKYEKITKIEESTSTEVPEFMVSTAPGFFDGSELHVPGTKVLWAKPDGWDSVRQGKHHTEHAPSLTFRPLNKAAEALLEKTRAARMPKK